eukprot:25828-Pyramimonas_sp.AAC.1
MLIGRRRADRLGKPTSSPVTKRWALLGLRWTSLVSDAMELELESKLDTPVRKKGKKGLPLAPQWASAMMPPKRKEDDEVRVWVSWVWLQQYTKNLLNTSQRLVVQMNTLVDQSEIQAARSIVDIVAQPFDAE